VPAVSDPKWLAKAEALAGFGPLRLDKDHHLGLGDIRLTVGQQEEIAARFARALEEAEILGKDKASRVALDILRERRAGEARCAYALTEAERALRAWTTPLAGMGSNITQEDRGRTGLALREIEKARALLPKASGDKAYEP
jgi:hypothetical protein